jgi:hypothetical protein
LKRWLISGPSWPNIWNFNLKSRNRKAIDAAAYISSDLGQRFFLPAVVLYGEKDTADQSKHPGHPGTTRLEFGRGWVDEMNEFGGVEKPTISLKIEKGFGHSSSRATVPCQKALMRLKWVEPPKTAIMRTWRSKSGMFRVDAKLVENNGTEIKLITEVGKEIEVKIAALSKTDLRFLEP